MRTSHRFLAGLLVLGSTSTGAFAAVTDTYHMSVSDGCYINYEFTANLVTQIDLLASDKDQIAALVYRNYRAAHDLEAELAKRLSSRSASIDVPTDTVQAVNGILAVGKLLDPSLELKINSARLDCPPGVLYDIQRRKQADHSAHRLKLERAISFIQDADATVQRRGFASLLDVASLDEIRALPDDQRSKVIELAYTQARSSVDALGSGGLPKDGFEFGPMWLLYALDDPRALDLYMATIERGHAALQGPALRALGRLQPRPTQVLDRLAALIEHNKIGWQAKEESLLTLIRIGRQGARPYFERFARGQDESLAQSSMEILDQLNVPPVIRNPPQPKSKERDSDVVNPPIPKI